MKGTFLHFRKRVVAIGTALYLCILVTGCSASEYQSAILAMEENNYDSALALFESLGSYKDSSNKADECKYALGIQAMSQENWELAIEYFGDVNYQDSKSLLDTCTKEKGMHDNADYDFLTAIESSIENRIDQNEKDMSLSLIVNSELGRLKTYENQTFYDIELYNLARKYISALELQNDALSKKHSELQILWQEGLVERLDVLSTLYENYGLFTGSSNFKDVYESQKSDSIALLNALKAIDYDLNLQLDNVEFDLVNDYTMSASYTNATEYDFDIQFYFTYYLDDIRVGESTEFFSNIKSKDTSFLLFSIPSYQWDTCEFFWEIEPHL